MKGSGRAAGLLGSGRGVGWGSGRGLVGGLPSLLPPEDDHERGASSSQGTPVNAPTPSHNLTPSNTPSHANARHSKTFFPKKHDSVNVLLRSFSKLKFQSPSLMQR